MKQLSKSHFILMVLGICFFISACHRNKKVIADSMITGTVTIAADEALRPLVNAELDVFHSIYNSATVDCNFVSEYDAINLLYQEKIRLAIVARPLTEKEIAFFKSRDILAESIPLAFDAVAVIVHPDNKTTALNTFQIKQILSGEVTNWSQFVASGKTGGIKQFFDFKSSGIIRSLNDSLHLNKKISGDISFVGSSKNLIEQVATDSNAIGFVGYNWLSEVENFKVQDALKRVRLLAISKSYDADSILSIKPSVSSLFNQNYPLTRKIYAIYTDPAASLSRGFLSHLTSERGQKIIYRVGLKPEQDFQRLVNIKND